MAFGWDSLGIPNPGMEIFHFGLDKKISGDLEFPKNFENLAIFIPQIFAKYRGLGFSEMGIIFRARSHQNVSA